MLVHVTINILFYLSVFWIKVLTSPNLLSVCFTLMNMTLTTPKVAVHPGKWKGSQLTRLMSVVCMCLSIRPVNLAWTSRSDNVWDRDLKVKSSAQGIVLAHMIDFEHTVKVICIQLEQKALIVYKYSSQVLSPCAAFWGIQICFVHIQLVLLECQIKPK